MQTMAARSQFLLRHLGPVPPIAAVLLALETTSIDATVSGWFFNPVAGVFPLRYHRFFAQHSGKMSRKRLLALRAGPLWRARLIQIKATCTPRSPASRRSRKMLAIF